VVHFEVAYTVLWMCYEAFSALKRGRLLAMLCWLEKPYFERSVKLMD